MKRKPIVLILGILLLGSFFMTPGWAEIYKWVDQDGNVHYGDKPPAETRGNTNASEVHVNNPKKPAAQEQGMNESPADRLASQKKMLEAMGAEREQKQIAEKEAANEKSRNERNCSRAKDGLRSYQEAGYLYDIDKNGERIILNDEKRSQAHAHAQAEVDKWCSPRRQH